MALLRATKAKSREGSVSDQTESHKALIRAHYEATINHFDPAKIDAQVAPDFVDHGSPGEAVRGPTGVKSQIASLHAAFPDLHVVVVDMIAEGDRVAVRSRFRGTHRGPFRGITPTGARIDVTGTFFWAIERGRIKERWGLLDTQCLLRQLGVP
ncbi:ester cyclase [Oleomonas cavernae]|uniref:Ester cyclase n=1 Tax=Oleomonas cavernae TaxID=2320859 RepID=A0A418WIC3_9PROT|nr:ester cyclase [Oleomonas cavernae]